MVPLNFSSCHSSTVSEVGFLRDTDFSSAHAAFSSKGRGVGKTMQAVTSKKVRWRDLMSSLHLTSHRSMKDCRLPYNPTKLYAFLLLNLRAKGEWYEKKSYHRHY